jgi:hypothetical protein
MKAKLDILRRAFYTTLASILMVGLIFPIFQIGQASAAQLEPRSITLSDSGPSGGSITSGVGSGTAVSYKVGITTSGAASSLIIDFCSNSALIGASCTAPTGMNAAGATLSSGTGNIGGWSSVVASASQVKLSIGTGTASAAGSQVFTLSNITNPSTTGTFYARIYTYAAALYPSYTSATSVGTYVDYGGVALSTAQVISITARVQESLTFCVSGSAQSNWTTTSTCTDPNAAVAPALTLGSGSPPVLTNTAVSYGTVYSQLSTNAINGAAVTLRNSNNTCGGLSSNGGTTCGIPAVGASASAITAGTAAFGLYVPATSNGTGGSGSLTPATTYAGAGVTTAPYDYGMNATNVDSTYGDTIETTSNPCYLTNSSYIFGATASLTTPAGVYTANMDMIATGTF